MTRYSLFLLVVLSVLFAPMTVLGDDSTMEVHTQTVEDLHEIRVLPYWGEDTLRADPEQLYQFIIDQDGTITKGADVTRRTRFNRGSYSNVEMEAFNRDGCIFIGLKGRDMMAPPEVAWEWRQLSSLVGLTAYLSLRYETRTPVVPQQFEAEDREFTWLLGAHSSGLKLAFSELARGPGWDLPDIRQNRNREHPRQVFIYQINQNPDAIDLELFGEQQRPENFHYWIGDPRDPESFDMGSVLDEGQAGIHPTQGAHALDIAVYVNKMFEEGSQMIPVFRRSREGALIGVLAYLCLKYDIEPTGENIRLWNTRPEDWTGTYESGWNLSAEVFLRHVREWRTGERSDRQRRGRR